MEELDMKLISDLAFELTCFEKNNKFLGIELVED